MRNIGLVLIALCVVSIGEMLLITAHAQGQTRSSRPSATTNGIRSVDFLNYTYHSSACRDELGESVRVSRGEFKNSDSYFSVDKKIRYADISGDGLEEAIIDTGCGAVGGNFSVTEVFVFTMQNGRPRLLATIANNGAERDYSRYYRDTEGEWWDLTGVAGVNNASIALNALAGGSHAMPRYVVTLEYRWTGQTFSLRERPRRLPFKG
jgi:hypothetical protein